MNLVNQIKEIFEQEPSNLGKIRDFLNSPNCNNKLSIFVLKGHQSDLG